MTNHDRDVLATLLESVSRAMFKAADQLREHSPEIEQPSAPPQPPSPDCLCTKELAEWLRVGPQTLRKWRINGRGPAYVRMGEYPAGAILYRRTDVEEWLLSRKKAHTSQEAAELQQRRP